MWSNSNVLAVTKSAVAQLISKGYMSVESGDITALDNQFIVDMGKAVVGDGTDTTGVDILFKSLVNQLGKIIVDSRSYRASLPRLFVDPVQWGSFVEFVSVDLSDVMIDEMWNTDGFIPYNGSKVLSDGTTRTGIEEGMRIAGIEHGYYKPSVLAKLYEKNHGIMVALTVAREQMFTAFKGLGEWESFLAGLYNSVENTLQIKAQIYALMTVSMGIATARANNNEINLLDLYKEETGSTTITADTALSNADFLRFALKTIAEVKDYIRNYNALYNDGEQATFSAESELILLNKFDKACKFSARSVTFNEQLLGIGEYDTVSAWQGAISASDNQAYSFDNASSIVITKDAAKDAGIQTNKSVRIDGVVGVLYDRYAMGITLDKRNTTSQYTASRDTTNLFYHALVNYIVNSHYPIVTFVVRDTIKTLDSPTVAGETGTLWGVTIGNYQSGITVTGNAITGTLTKDTNSDAWTNVWGKGYFLVLKFTKTDTNIKDIFVGLSPSADSMFLQKLDDDMNALFKITDPTAQVLKVRYTDGTNTYTDTYTLSGLTLS